jgi:hypothetical protein
MGKQKEKSKSTSDPGKVFGPRGGEQKVEKTDKEKYSLFISLTLGEKSIETNFYNELAMDRDEAGDFSDRDLDDHLEKSASRAMFWGALMEKEKYRLRLMKEEFKLWWSRIHALSKENMKKGGDNRPTLDGIVAEALNSVVLKEDENGLPVEILNSGRISSTTKYSCHIGDRYKTYQEQMATLEYNVGVLFQACVNHQNRGTHLQTLGRRRATMTAKGFFAPRDND